MERFERSRGAVQETPVERALDGIELALLKGPKHARQHTVRVGPRAGSVATADFARDSRAERVLGTPVRGVDRIRFEEKRKYGREFHGEVGGKASRDASSTGRSMRMLS
jgi:hypothetical protein